MKYQIGTKVKVNDPSIVTSSGRTLAAGRDHGKVGIVSDIVGQLHVIDLDDGKRVSKVAEELLPVTKYGYSLWHDAVLDECRQNHGTCPFGCVKDGAPNCWYHVQRLECSPSKEVDFIPF